MAIHTFPPKGLVWFWCLNDDCKRAHYRRMIRDFAAAQVGAVILHSRDGLLLPFGGEAWFEMIRGVVDDCVKAGVQVWLYDEDPFPAGNAGGWVVAEHPEFIGQAIERFEAPADLKTNELFLFPTGRLLWAGLVPAAGQSGVPNDLTPQVGIVRRHWEANTQWDSRWYYPATPLYDAPRAAALYPEFALRKPSCPRGWKLVAFVARPAGKDSTWQALVDTLNPAATRAFIARVYQRYADAVGQHFGRAIPAIFSDEAKPHARIPWTPGLFESFQANTGYDLLPRLEHLFQTGDDPTGMLTRLHYREWVTRRFEKAWVQPVSAWCSRNKLAFVGHISPEDDLVQQVGSIGNLMPLHRHFSLCGLDLIVPAIGDRRHTQLNIGTVCAVSVAQQTGKTGVLCETLGCSGVRPNTAVAARILAWHTVMGVNSPVIHGAFASSLGLRRIEAPPDFGPLGPAWTGMGEINEALRPFWDLTRDAAQVAPVAVLWPMRHFWADGKAWENEDIGPRRDFNVIVSTCLEHQVGVQVLDDPELAAAKMRGSRLALGRASYETLLVPPMRVMEDRTFRRLQALHRAGFPVRAFGETPSWLQTSRGLKRAPRPAWPVHPLSELPALAEKLFPSLLGVNPHSDLRVSAWVKQRRTCLLAMNTGRRALPVVNGVILPPGTLVAMECRKETWQVLHRFDTRTVTPSADESAEARWSDWAVRWPGRAWQSIDRPKAVYEVCPIARNPQGMLFTSVTPTIPLGSQPVADWLEYRGQFHLDRPARQVKIQLEPTALQGCVTVSAGSWHRSVTLRNTDLQPVELVLRLPRKTASLTLRFRFAQPMPEDGIKLAPRVCGAFKQKQKASEQH